MTTTSTEATTTLSVATAGLIGAGKTTLTERLGGLLNATVLREPVADNPYLEDFYAGNPVELAMEVELLCRRAQQYYDANVAGQRAIFDRSIYEDYIFALMLHEAGRIESRSFATYRKLFIHMMTILAALRQHNQVVLYLRASTQRCLSSILKRMHDNPERACESSITVGYLDALASAYERFFATDGTDGHSLRELLEEANVPEDQRPRIYHIDNESFDATDKALAMLATK